MKKFWLVRLWRDRRGQALAEAGIVMPILVGLTVVALDFGHAFYAANMMTHALRDGARVAATTPLADRDANGFIVSTAAIEDRVRAVMEQALGSSMTSGFSINVTQPTQSGVNMVSVGVNENIPYLVGLLGTGFNYNRSISFRDEGR